MGLVTWTIILLTLLSSFCTTSGKLALWTDISFWGPTDFEELDFKLGFLMDNYDIISLEKCLWENDPGDDQTEDMFQRLVSRMRELRPNSTASILYYWHVSMSYQCYDSIDYLQTRPDLWFNDTNGYPVMYGGHKKPFFDYRIPEAFDIWVSSALEQVELCEGKCQGVYLDGIRHTYLSNCQVKTCGENADSCCELTEEDELEWNKERIRATGVLRDRLHDLDPTYIVIGNDLANWDFNSHNTEHSIVEDNIDVVDGFCMDHFMTFEDVQGHAPFVKPNNIENRIKDRNTILEANKTLVLKGSPGPVGTPWKTIGGLQCPTLPTNYPYPQPTTNLEVQQAYKDLLDFPLAVYLCGFAAHNVFFSYALRHDLRQAVPCVNKPEDCQMPMDFDQLFANDPGAPLTEPIWTGRNCTRQFENFGVFVNIEDENSVMWLP